MKYCPKCGEHLNDNETFCTKCGNKTETNVAPQTQNSIFCPKCNSNNISIQVINESHLVPKHHGIIWWIFVGWWWMLVKWLMFTLPALIFKILGIGKRQKIKNKTYKLAVCQNCTNSWKI